MSKILENFRVLAGGLFYLGIGGFFLGYLITFVPGAEVGYYITTAVLLVFGLLIPGWHRVVAILLLIACSFEIYEGQQQGLKYRQRLEEIRARRSVS